MAKFGFYRTGGSATHPTEVLLAEFDGDYLQVCDSGVVKIIDSGNNLKAAVYLRPGEWVKPK